MNCTGQDMPRRLKSVVVGRVYEALRRRYQLLFEEDIIEGKPMGDKILKAINRLQLQTRKSLSRVEVCNRRRKV